jgi:threonine/homoserine/homoserine lactone efflux protein
MLPVLLSVVVISLTGVMIPGPMFAVVLTKSYKSAWAGTLMSLGHAVVEVPVVLLVYFGFAQIFQNSIVQLVMSLLGGGMVLWLGVGMFRARTEVVEKGKDLPYNAFVAGIFVTGLNPLFLLWWATIGSMLTMRVLSYAVLGLAAFIIVHWLCDLFWLSFVSVLVYRTHSIWGKKFQEWLFVACSLLLVGFGVWFIVSGIQTMV